MKPPLAHFALRELHDLSRARGVLVGVAATGAILGLIGPFGTDEALPMVWRLVYWVVICGLTFATGQSLAGAIVAWGAQAGWRPWAAIALASLLSAAVICAQVLAINALVFGSVSGQADPLTLGVTIALIVAIVTVATHLITPANTDDALETPRLIDRLPMAVRGPLVALSVTDHYVHVTTQTGTHLLLMRLSDAIAETAPTPGLQIHRSHWVALAAIDSVARISRKYEVVLTNGTRLAVSRTYLPQLKEAGFLPRSDA